MAFFRATLAKHTAEQNIGASIGDIRKMHRVIVKSIGMEMEMMKLSLEGRRSTIPRAYLFFSAGVRSANRCRLDSYLDIGSHSNTIENGH